MRVNIATAENPLDTVDALSDAGLEVEQVLVFTHTVVGSVDPTEVERLRAVDGVVSVDADSELYAC